MHRVKLELPSSFQFSTEIPLRISDINYNNHLGNDAILSLIHEARVQFLKHYGYTELDIEGVGIIMGDAVLVFKSEAFYGDAVVIDVAVDELRHAGCDFVYRLTNKKSGKEIARAKTGIAFFDYAQRRVTDMPETFRTLFERK